ncbi:MAG: hypothetical protein JST14_02075 [Bacteroidetes bacterium]|nr:hypothetical protein [Bacteroidota bacterium]
MNKTRTARNRISHKTAVVSGKVKDYGNDPFFVKKAKRSKTFLEKHGFPEQIVSATRNK